MGKITRHAFVFQLCIGMLRARNFKQPKINHWRFRPCCHAKSRHYPLSSLLYGQFVSQAKKPCHVDLCRHNAPLGAFSRRNLMTFMEGRCINAPHPPPCKHTWNPLSLHDSTSYFFFYRRGSFVSGARLLRDTVLISHVDTWIKSVPALDLPNAFHTSAENTF